ncbi:hypothetical protein K2173_000456 [Erythroxylum novogranatense]|uniref:Glycosyltransferase n=1 Tax=Erythroxylum novogranatense TaxID=1862640 RepID=A0AAV8SX99_9ROSI|nr:hypothetical protein K2173_000456 [Erythroxylum novogranatense]
MQSLEKTHVALISSPTIGNLVPTVEFAQRLVDRDSRLTATILIVTMSQRRVLNDYIQSRVSTTMSGVNFIPLPVAEPPKPDQYQSSMGYMSLFIAKHKVHVKEAIVKHRFGGLFIDMFCTSMIDVANELGVPCYLYFQSPASFLGFMLHLPTLETQFTSEFTIADTGLLVPKDPTLELDIPSFVNPLPLLVLPSSVLKRTQDGYFWFLQHALRYKETRGLVVNTFKEIEQHAVNSISASNLPPVYTIGPVLDLAGPVQWHPDKAQQGGVMKWLDDQPSSSVVFLCFGSMGSLSSSQLKEIAVGLEQTRIRFLWSIREPPKGKLDLPGEYANLEEILPEGFMERTATLGLVCGWVPQVTILGHQAIGGFVSHCGWNSILESLWYGVPIATWPVYAEQQMNAFQLVKELGLAVELRLDYREGSDLVVAEELERALRRLMDGGGDHLRRKVKEMSDMSRKAVMENGSSYVSLGSLIHKLIAEAA